MEEVALQESVVVCELAEAPEVRGIPLRLEPHAAVFELLGAGNALQVGTVIKTLRVQLQGRLVYGGPAVVRNVVPTGVSEICEVTLKEGWPSTAALAAVNEGELSQSFSAFFEDWRRQFRVRDDFKILVADMATLFGELRLWLEPLEVGFHQGLSGPTPIQDRDRRAREMAAARELAPVVAESIDALWERFAPIATQLAPAEQPLHRAYLRHHLLPLLMCSPFGRRAYQKPLGYAGDYELVNMIARNPLEGDSLFAKMINYWLLNQAPSEGHRNRLKYLKARLVDESVRCSSRGRPFRVFNVACGPALEIQRFLDEPSSAVAGEFTLLDFNEETVEYARAALEKAARTRPRSVSFRFLKKSVYHLLRETTNETGGPEAGRHELVYCAGLFDYLTNPVCQRLMKVMYSWVAPGGMLLITNVDTSKAIGLSLDYMLDWPLIYRTAAELRAVAAEVLPPEDTVVRSDHTGMNLFLEVRKPEYGH